MKLMKMKDIEIGKCYIVDIWGDPDCLLYEKCVGTDEEGWLIMESPDMDYPSLIWPGDGELPMEEIPEARYIAHCLWYSIEDGFVQAVNRIANDLDPNQ
jgi:hypothetical protein